MIIENVPFYPNLPDDTHCFQAVLKMVLKYYLPDVNYSFTQLDKLSDKVEGMWTWATRALINLHQMGFQIVNMENFDYQEFSKSGERYLLQKFGKEMAEEQTKHSDINKEMIDAKEFVKIFGNNFVLPEIANIKKLIDQSYLVGCNVNAKALNKLPGYEGHSILVFGYDKDYLYLHDPGSPPQPKRQVSFSDFTNAWAYPTHENQNLTAFKLIKK